MFGGLCRPDELRAIADACDKYDVPEVKVTGGQRIDMFGVKKEDLPAMWKDLGEAGLVSGHAYGKALRTVKTLSLIHISEPTRQLASSRMPSSA